MMQVAYIVYSTVIGPRYAIATGPGFEFATQAAFTDDLLWAALTDDAEVSLWQIKPEDCGFVDPQLLNAEAVVEVLRATPSDWKARYEQEREALESSGSSECVGVADTMGTIYSEESEAINGEEFFTEDAVISSCDEIIAAATRIKNAVLGKS